MDRLSPVVVTAAFVLSAASASAQTPFRHSGAESKHSGYSMLPGERIDPASGSLSLVATDLVLPGNAGFDLRVTRVYNSNIYPNYDSGNTEIEEDSWAGIGWRLHFGRVLSPEATGGGETVIEFGDGGRQALHTTTAYPEGWMTAGFARYDRTNHTLKLPNGYIYTFSHVTDLGGTIGIVRYVTEIRDPFNNKIEFSYFSDPGPRDGVSQIRQYLSATQIRYIDFEYDLNGKTLKKMTYEGREWNYTHDLVGGAGLSVLRHAKPPLLQWGDYYDYSATMPGELTRYWTPNGGWADYTYQDAFRRASTLINRTRVVSQRTTGGRLINGGTWTFQYGVGTNEDTTVVSCACGVTRYRFNGVGLTGDFSGWKSGTLAERAIEKANGTVLERHEYTWVRSEAISPDDVDGEGGVWSDDAVYRALMQTVTITRGSQSWTTTNEYHAENFNDFGQPWKTTESGDFTRTTQRTFENGFTAHILGRPTAAEIRVGPEIAPADWDYDLATGFLKSSLGWGSSLQRFVARSDGNPESYKDGRDNVTTFENYTWGKPQIVRTPKVRTDFTINPDGTVATVTGAVTVTYGYDALFRPGQTSSPGVNAVTTSFDNFGGTGFTTTRGGASVATLIDGFGRVVQTTASTGVKVRTVYDACGRPTFVSMPYTNGIGSLGTTTQYDELGRVVTVTTPGNAMTQYAYTGIDVSVTDAENRVTVYDYSAAGSPGAARLISVRDATNTLTTYTYDVLDNLTKVSGPGTLPDRIWVFDSNANLMSDTQPESGTTTYAHDGAGNLTRKTNALNQEVLFEYDENNRLKKFNPPGTADDVTFTYDDINGHGRLVAQSTDLTGITYGYNAAGQLASRTDTVSPHGFVSTYQYDLNENLTKIVYPSGREVVYEYDTHHRLIRVKQKNPNASQLSIFADNFTYDDAGRLASYTTGSTTHTMSYDSTGRPSQLTTGALLNLTYSYDKLGNVLTVGGTTQPQQTFTYDTLNRLSTASGPWGQQGWGYTPSGDRLWERLGPYQTNYTYDSATRRLTATTGTRPENFSYDAVGQLTQDGRGTYTYDASGLVQQFTNTGATVNAAYRYDPAGLRVAKTVNQVTTYTVRSAGGQVLSEFRAACGNPVWTRDVIYAGGRLLGAVKAVATEPTVTLTSATASVGEGAGTINVTVRLNTPWGSGGSPCPVTVNYAAIASLPESATTAAKDVDFVVASGSVTFPVGSVNNATRTIQVAITQDARDENDETFTVTLTSVEFAKLSGLDTQTITIVDDDNPPTVSILDVSSGEGPSQSSMLLTVSLSEISGKDVTANYTFADVTATASADYTTPTGQYTGTVTVPRGYQTATIEVLVLPDSVDEPPETFDVTLSNPANATLGDGVGRGTITDDDPTPLSIGNVVVHAGKVATFSVTLSLPPDAPVTVNWSTANETAVGGTDYYANSGVITFPIGNTSQTVQVTTIGDAPEGDERFYVSLSNPTGSVVLPGPAIGTIVNRRKGDFNGDGHPDYLWELADGVAPHPDGTLMTWLMMNGVTRLSAESFTPTAIGTGWNVAGVGDFTDDGYQDLLLQHSDGTIRVWKLTNLARQGDPLALSHALVDPLWQVKGAGDMNADGKPDIVFHHPTSGDVAVWLMNGLTRQSASGVGNPGSTNWQISAVADMNGDGKDDLVWQHQTSGYLAAWYLNGGALLESVNLNPYQEEVLAWKIRGAADYDSDGKPDLLWHHLTNDWIVVWFMNGVVMTSGVSPTPHYLNATLWHLAGPR